MGKVKLFFGFLFGLGVFISLKTLKMKNIPFNDIFTSMLPDKNISQKEDFSANSEDEVYQNRIFKAQEGSRRGILSMAKSYVSIHNAIVPEVRCETKVRIGTPHDGGKWICNPWLLPANAVIYSFGSGGENTFETQLASLLFQETKGKKYSILTFDNNKKFATKYPKNDTTYKFYPYRITAAGNSPTEISFGTAMEKFKHSFVDVLKIDIESSEYTVLPPILALIRPNNTLICQILIEFHGQGIPVVRNKNEILRKWIHLMADLSKAGFRLFSEEINLFCTGGCAVEYSYIHLSCLKKYHASLIAHNLF